MYWWRGEAGLGYKRVVWGGRGPVDHPGLTPGTPGRGGRPGDRLRSAGELVRG